MNADTIEFKATEEATLANECPDVLALSFDDLDLVSGGYSTIGNLN